jgi:hypothetical protein
MASDEHVNGTSAASPSAASAPSVTDLERCLGQTSRDLRRVCVSTLAIATVAGVLAAVFVVSGVEHALAQLGRREWIGELGAGAVVLTLLFLARRVVRRRVRRQLLADAVRPDAPQSP